MPTETMTPRERWLAVLNRRKPDRMPMDYWATNEATDKLLRHLGCSDAEEMFRRLHIDHPIGAGPSGWGPPGDGGCDVFGCRWKMVQYATGAYLECVEHPLERFGSLAELKAEYTWPTVDRLDFSQIPQQIKGREEYPVVGGGSEPFLTYCELRGREQAYKDLIVNREFVEYCLDKLFGLAYTITSRIYEQIPGRVMLSYIGEDFGSQEDLLVSPKLIREVFLPRMKRMADLAHSAGVLVFTHSDGAVRRIIPDFIEMGADVLNPIQWRCKGMEREGLKRDFGDRIVFHGGIDNQQTLPFGTVADVRQEVQDNIRILGAGGGYILAPCHNIQAVSPVENVVAMYETGYAEGWT
jgi:uroporphyrinogen decarboxylase